MNIGQIRLIQITDTHCFANDVSPLTWSDPPVLPNIKLQAIIEHLKSESLGHSVLILTGDLAQEEVPETYQRIDLMLADFPLPIYTLPGNHDRPKFMKELLSNVESSKELVLGPWHLFMLNTHKDESAFGELSDVELCWLRERLMLVPRDQHVALFMHHHPIDIGSEWMDQLGLKGKEVFWKLLGDFPQVRAIFHGHIHQEFEGQHLSEHGHNVKVYGTPATCLQFRPRSQMKEIDHDRSAWREIVLHLDGVVETKVNYLAI